MGKREKREMTKRAEAIVEKLRAGEILHAQISAREEDRGGFHYWLEPSGRNVGPATAQEVRGLPFVEDMRDGLLPDASQSWRYAG